MFYWSEFSDDGVVVCAWSWIFSHAYSKQDNRPQRLKIIRWILSFRFTTIWLYFIFTICHYIWFTAFIFNEIRSFFLEYFFVCLVYFIYFYNIWSDYAFLFPHFPFVVCFFPYSSIIFLFIIPSFFYVLHFFSCHSSLVFKYMSPILCLVICLTSLLSFFLVCLFNSCFVFFLFFFWGLFFRVFSVGLDDVFSLFVLYSLYIRRLQTFHLLSFTYSCPLLAVFISLFDFSRFLRFSLFLSFISASSLFFKFLFYFFFPFLIFFFFLSSIFLPSFHIFSWASFLFLFSLLLSLIFCVLMHW